jgi:hypothetical protein
LELADLAKKIKRDGILHLKEGNGKVMTFMKPEDWELSKGKDWIFLIFELFQIRTICEPFSEVSLDIVEFASKPTIYHSTPNRVLKTPPLEDGNLRFSIIREPSWNKFLFQLSQPILVKLDTNEKVFDETTLVFPLFSPNVKELMLGAEGDVKIIKG